MGDFVRKAVRGLLAVSCVALAALAPVDANWETGEIEVAEATCQGPDCRFMPFSLCEGYLERCNLVFKYCREAPPPGEW